MSVGVHRHLNCAVPEQLLDGAQIGAAVEEIVDQLTGRVDDLLSAGVGEGDRIRARQFQAF